MKIHRLTIDSHDDSGLVATAFVELLKVLGFDASINFTEDAAEIRVIEPDKNEGTKT